MGRKKKKTFDLNDLKSFEFNKEIIDLQTFPLDCLLNGGYEKGSLNEIVGEAMTGKTTIACQLAWKLCINNHKVLYVDTDGKVSKNMLETIGLAEYLNSNFFYVRFSSFSKVEEVLDSYILTDEIDFIIIDSIASLISDVFTNLESGVSITTSNSAYNSRPLTNFISKYNAIAKEKNICFLFINQLRNKVDPKLGTLPKIYGSKNIQNNCSTIIKISSINKSSRFSNFKDYPKYSKGCDLEFELIKSNRTIPNKKVPFYFSFGSGIESKYNVIYGLIENKIVIQENGCYKFKDNDVVDNYFPDIDNLFEKIDYEYVEKYRDDIYQFYNK